MAVNGHEDHWDCSTRDEWFKFTVAPQSMPLYNPAMTRDLRRLIPRRTERPLPTFVPKLFLLFTFTMQNGSDHPFTSDRLSDRASITWTLMLCRIGKVGRALHKMKALSAKGWHEEVIFQCWCDGGSGVSDE